MKDKRILYVSSEVVPYLPETEISSMSFEAPRMVNKQGGQMSGHSKKMKKTIKERTSN